MKFLIRNTQAKCSPLFCLLIVFSVVSENTEAFLMHMSALLLHEAAHFLMARMLCCEIPTIELQPYGCRMEISNMYSPWDELMIALAGPVCSLICYMGSRLIPEAAEFARANIHIALFNLLPVMPLDGGRALNSVLSLIGIAINRKVRFAGGVILSAAAGVMGYILKNITLIIFSVFLLKECLELSRQRNVKLHTFMRNLRRLSSGKGMSVRHIAVSGNVTVGRALSYAGEGHTVFCILDDDMRERKRIDAMQLADYEAKYGRDKRLNEVVSFLD